MIRGNALSLGRGALIWDRHAESPRDAQMIFGGLLLNFAGRFGYSLTAAPPAEMGLGVAGRWPIVNHNALPSS